MKLDVVAPGERRNHLPSQPPFYWQDGPYGATAEGTTDRHLIVPGREAIEPRVTLWIRELGGWRKLSPLSPADERHARQAMATMEADIMTRYLSQLNVRSGV